MATTYKAEQNTYKPIVLNGRKIKRIYTFDAMQGGLRGITGSLDLYSEFREESLGLYVTDSNNSRAADLLSPVSSLLGLVSPFPFKISKYPSTIHRSLTKCLILTPKQDMARGVQTKIGYIEVSQELNTSGNPRHYYTVYEDSTKQTVLVAKTTFWSAAYDAQNFVAHVLKMNDTCYMLIYHVTYTTNATYDKYSGHALGLIFTKKNGAVVASAGFLIGEAVAQTSAASSRYLDYRCGYIGSMNDDNTQFINIRKCYSANYNGADTVWSIYTNNSRWRSSTAVGLRTTAWTTAINNVAYINSNIKFYEGLGVDFYFPNSSSGAIIYQTYLSRQGDWYGAQPLNVAATSTIDPQGAAGVTKERAPFRMYGMVGSSIGIERYIYIDNRYVKNYHDGYIYTPSVWYAEIDKANRAPINKTALDDYDAYKLIDDLPWRTLIVNEEYLYPAFAFMKEGQLIIGMRKESYDSYSYGNNDGYEEHIRCMAYTVQIDTIGERPTFKFAGYCEGGTFRNENLLNIDLSPQVDDYRTVPAYAEYFDEHTDQYAYDAFRTWVLEYETADTYVVYNN